MEPAGLAERLDSVSFADAYVSQYDALVRLAYFTTGDMGAAEDIVQEAFAELYRQMSTVEMPEAWLRRVVANRSISWLRRLATARAYLTGTIVQGHHDPPSAEDATVRRALLKLKPRHRAAVFLRFYMDMSEADIAEALGCRPGTVKSILHRALTSLREDLS
jgi:RNA polymerase sigma-70 factor (sigma-E family)